MPIREDADVPASQAWADAERQIAARSFLCWYDLTVTVDGDPSSKYQLAGHVETEKDSISDPALGGLVILKS